MSQLITSQQSSSPVARRNEQKADLDCSVEPAVDEEGQFRSDSINSVEPQLKGETKKEPTNVNPSTYLSPTNPGSVRVVFNPLSDVDHEGAKTSFSMPTEGLHRQNIVEDAETLRLDRY